MSDVKKNSNIIYLQEVAIARLEKKLEQQKSRRRDICEMAARSILQALDLKDHYTFDHSTRVAYYSRILGEEMELTKEELHDLEMASLFHDLGKIGIPDAILLKKEHLSEQEFRVMCQHPIKSAEILERFDDFKKIALYAKHHHERFDGKGYPDGLKGEDIPLFSRMILICDTFDSMTSSRTYRKAMNHQTAIEELEEFAGSQFDPGLVKIFIKALDRDQNKKEDTFTLEIVKGNFIKNAA